jgi:transcriptional regulator with XRE-family HTH domain
MRNIEYRIMRERCGLSVDEAAAYHGVSPCTVRSWTCGRRNPPQEVLADLSKLYIDIEYAAREHQGGCLRKGHLVDDAWRRLGPKGLGLPCDGAVNACVGIILARKHGAGEAG